MSVPRERERSSATGRGVEENERASEELRKEAVAATKRERNAGHGAKEASLTKRSGAHR